MMLHPIGGLPPQIYWRRRLTLVGVVIALSLAAGWFFLGGASGDPDGSTDAGAQASSEESTGDGPLTGLEQVVPSLTPVDAADAADASEAGAPAESSTPVPTSAPAEPGPCPDEAIGLTVGAEFAEYAAGSKPLLGLNITNISAVPCLRDLDLALQTWGLFAADGTRLWGSNDCYPDSSLPSVTLLQPGQVVAFTIIWSGQTSDPTCELPRQTLGPGTYILRGYLANLVSPDAPLVLV